MTFEQAVAHIRAAASASVAAYAFVPTVRRGETAGGVLYAISFDAEATADEDPILVDYLAGTFASGDGAADVFTPDDVPDEALDLTYERTETYDATLTEYSIDVALAVLRGATLDDALASAAAASPTGPNATPEALTADLLIAFGMPATLPPPAGALPAAIVLLDADDPRLGRLVDAFGGIVIGDVAAGPTPADEMAAATRGGARDAGEEVAPGDTPRDADDLADGDADEADDADDEVAEAAWVGVGRGAVLATLLATRALPEWEGDPRADVAGDLPADLADAWRALLEFATAAIESPPDDAGRRPKPVYQQLRRLADKIDRLVARQIAGHAELLAAVAAAVAREIADGTFIDEDLALPTRAELDGPVPLPGAVGGGASDE